MIDKAALGRKVHSPGGISRNFRGAASTTLYDLPLPIQSDGHQRRSNFVSLSSCLELPDMLRTSEDEVQASTV